ncbi:MAG TPA: hypothetical protein VER12_12200 [Polyangiaceae bacterium]|nr:hypothetical protein [Polyangiaceae bacterium]
MAINRQLRLATPVALGFLALACFGSRSEKKLSPEASEVAAVKANSIKAPSPAEQDLQLLRARVAGLEAELRTPRASPVTGAVVDAAARTIDNPTLSRRLPGPATLQAHYDVMFANEKADLRWAPEQENAVLAFFASVPTKGVRLEKAECRESLCRIRVHFDDRGARTQFLTNIGSPPFDHGGFYRSDEATGALTLYTARAGRTLPSVDSGPT